MNRINNLINKIKISLIHKKSTIKIKFNKKDKNLIKLLTKINLIMFSKILKNFIIIKINNDFFLKIKTFIKKKKITIKKINKKKNNFEKKIVIVSNNLGLSIWKKSNVGGFVLFTAGI